MTTASPSSIAVANEDVAQNLYTINVTPTIPAAPDVNGAGTYTQFPAMPGAVYYSPLSDTAKVEFTHTVDVVGEDITFDAETSTFTLATDQTYSLNALVESNVPGAMYAWYNLTSGDQLNFRAVPIGTPVSATITTTEETDVVLYAFTYDAAEPGAGTVFQYPNQLFHATATVQSIAGFTV